MEVRILNDNGNHEDYVATEVKDCGESTEGEPMMKMRAIKVGSPKAQFAWFRFEKSQLIYCK